MNKKKKSTSRSSGFTLIELLVVVAIIGILAAVGIVAYNGYVSSTKQKSVENALMQLSLGQTEYYSDNSTYYGTSGSTCTPSASTSDAVEDALVDKAELFATEVGFNVCAVQNSPALYFLIAKETGGTCEIKLTGNTQSITRTNC